jgi:subtilisin family serine protease
MNPYSAAGLLGTNQVIGIADSGLDVQSCYFKDANGNIPFSINQSPIIDASRRKVIVYCHTSRSDTADQKGGHGTHVAGTAAGSIDGANMFSSGGMYDGVAPAAKIAFFDLGDGTGSLTSVPTINLYLPGRNAGARIFTNSWGNYYSGTPFYSAADIDKYLYTYMDTLILFSVGNAGDKMPDPSISSVCSGKNVVCVGSSESTLSSNNINNVAYYSSKGPAYDGRYKPDIVAPGHALVSALASGTTADTCATTQKTGTSMASPAAAGAAVLIRQYFMDVKFWKSHCKPSYNSCKVFTPSGVLLKAMLLHSGSKMSMYAGATSNQKVALGNPPDSYQGYGRITLKKVLPLASGKLDLFVADLVSVGANSFKTYYLHVTDTSLSVKVTLVWYDPPNINGISSKALLHDLNLRMVSPSKQIFYGNGKVDAINTVEQVTIPTPVSGTYQITVSSLALPKASTQTFSLVVTSAGYIGSLF